MTEELRSRGPRIWLTLLWSCLAIVLVGIALLPTILSTGWGQQRLLRLVNQEIPGKVSAEKIQLGWFGPQRAYQLTLHDVDGKPVVTIQQLSSDSSLFSFLWRSYKCDAFAIEGLNGTLTLNEEGISNLHHALGLADKSPTLATTPLVIALNDANIRMQLPQEGKPLSFKAHGSTQQGDRVGTFTIDLQMDNLDANTLSGENLLRRILAKDSTAGGLQFSATLQNFPVQLLDQLFSLQQPKWTGLISAALGDTLDLKFENIATPTGVHFTATATSPTLMLDAAGQIQNERLTFTRPGKVHFVIVPELANQIAKLNQLRIPLALANKTNLEFTVDQLSVPLDFLTDTSPGGGRSKAALLAHLTLAQAELVGHPLLGTITLRQLEATVNAPESANVAVMQLQGEAVQRGRPIQIKLGATVDKPANLEALLDSIQQQATIDVGLDNVPTALLDETFNTSELITRLFGPQLSLTGSLVAEKKRGVIKAAVTSDKIVIPDLVATYQGKPLKKATWEMASHFQFIDHPRLIAALGTQLKIALQGTFDAKQGLFEPLEVEMDSDLLHTRLQGRLQNRTFALLTPAEVYYTLTRSFLEGLHLLNPQMLALAVDAPTLMTIDPLTLPLDRLSLAESIVSGSIVAESLQFTGGHAETLTLQNLDLPWNMDGPADRINLRLSGTTRLAKDAVGTLKGDLHLRHWLNQGKIDFQNAEITTQLNFGQVPVLLLEGLSGQTNLQALLGTALDLVLGAKLEVNKLDNSTVDAILSGDRLRGEVALKLGKAITLKDPNRPLVIQATVTPERFQALRRLMQRSDRQDTLRLNAPAQLQAVVHTLNIPQHDASEPYALIADLSLDKLNVADLMQTTAFENLQMHFESADLAKKMTFKIDGQERGNAHDPFPLSVVGTMENFLTPQGAVNTDGLSLNLDVRTRGLPAGLFCQVGCLDETIRNKIEALLGETVDTDIKVQLTHMEGPVLVVLEGKNGKVTLDAQLNDGVLTLNAPFEIKVAVTPKLGKSILQDILPILSGVISADNPLKITIDSKGFAFPVGQLDLSQVQIGLATIDMGKMMFGREGQLGIILDLLRPSTHEDLSVWFTPLYLTMQNGVVGVGRMDMLVMNSYPLAIWGKVDTVRDKVDMRIGLTGTALSQALKIKELEKNYMMQLPLKGQMGKATIDVGKATARISALVAQNRGGTQSKIIATFLDIAGGALAEDRPPEPTTTPLPWEAESK